MINIMRILQNELNDEKEYRIMSIYYDQIKHAFYHRDFMEIQLTNH